MVLSLELWPREEVVAWAAGVVGAHPNHNVLVNTHHLTSSAGSLSSALPGYGSTSPQYLYDNLLTKYPNIRMTFSGHVNGALMTSRVGANGNPIHSFVDGHHNTTTPQTRLIEISTTRGTLTSRIRANPADPTSLVASGTHDLSGMRWVLPDSGKRCRHPQWGWRHRFNRSLDQEPGSS